MNYATAQLTSRVAITACCLALILAAASSCHAAMPDTQPQAAPAALPELHPTVSPTVADREAAHDELIGRMLTPRAEIHLGPGLANTERLMRRASNPSLSYTIRSLWAGVVEYVFPAHGLFRRGDMLARVYDPLLLRDLERARTQMDTERVRPLTIAAPARRTDAELPVITEPEAQPTTTAQLAPTPTPANPSTVSAEPVEVPDFDFAANHTEQQQLREEAAMAGTTIPAAIELCAEAFKELDAAQDELAQRHRLLDEGALAEQALRPAEERVAQARATYDEAEATLAEAQEGYERVEARIDALEAEAEEAHRAIQEARAANVRRVEAASQPQGETAAQAPTISLEPRDPATDPAAEAQAPDAEQDRADAVKVYHVPEEMRELTAPRWEDLSSEAPGVISEVLAPDGTVVEAGAELMRVANLQLAHLTARVALSDLADFQVGRSVTVEFDEYPDAVFGGWVSEIDPQAGTDEAEVGLLVVCQSGRFADDPYLALRWMTLESGVGREKVTSESLEPVLTAPRSADTDVQLARMFPTVGPGNAFAERASEPTAPVADHFAGRLQLQPMERLTDPGSEPGEGAERLAALNEWRKTYVDGMTTAMLDNGACISYPADGDVSDAVRLMLEARVSHRPNLCAATMREALGWGLGDAHQWATRLPRVGYVPREDGIPRPGDILVWPFTYGPNRSQHIGFAVRQGRKLMLLSNLSGSLGTTEVLGGYIAFYKPEDQPVADAGQRLTGEDACPTNG